MNKKPFVTKEQLDEITAKISNPVSICMTKKVSGTMQKQ